MSRFGNHLGRGSNNFSDPETDAMQEELSMYHKEEHKEYLREELARKRSEHKGKLDAHEQAKADELKNVASRAGFTITDARRDK